LFCVALTFLVPVAQSSAQSLDSSFVPELTSDVVINSMAVQPDGKVIVAFGLGPHFLNAETNFIRANEVSLVRLDANGSLDPTFARVPHASTPFRRSASAVVLLTDGSAIVAGDFFVPGTFWHTGMVKVSSNGVVEQSYHGAVGNGQIRDMLLQPDGKLLVCGFNQVASGSTNVGIVRLQPDGTVDPSFGSSISHENDLVRIDTICLQPDGKLVIGGSFTHVDSIYLPHLARLNANGSLDGSFQPMLQEPADVESVTRQSDGRLLIGGQLTISNGAVRTPLVRLETNGVLDPTFITGPTGESSDVVYGTLALEDGKILAFGVFDHYAGQPAGSIVRLQSNGTLDPTFDVGTLGPPNYGGITKVAFDAGGRMLVSAKFLEFNRAERHAIARFITVDAPGTVQFVSTNVVVAEDQEATAELTVTRLDGRSGPVSVAYCAAGGNAISGFDYGGSTGVVAFVDGEFAPKSFAIPIHNDALEEESKFFHVQLSGPGNGVRVGNPSLAKVTIPANDFVGGIDSSFLPGYVAVTGSNCPTQCYDYSEVTALAVQPDGKILVGGTFKRTDSPSGLVRLNPDGSLDAGFHIGDGVDGSVSAVTVQPDGKIMIGGYFVRVSGVAATNVARLQTDGTPDPSFVSPLAWTAGVRCLAVQSDGKVVIGGYLHGFSETDYELLGRLNADGSIDRSFAARLYDWNGDSGVVNKIIVDAADRLYLLGNLQFTPDMPIEYHLARLASDGSWDERFAPRERTNSPDVMASSILPLPDGKLLLTGWFSQIESEPRPGLARLYSDGSLDRSFVPGLPVGTRVNAVCLQPDGRIVVLVVNDVYQFGVRRLNRDGSLDPSFHTFQTRGSYSERIVVMALGLGGAIIVAGEFDWLANGVRHNIAQLISDVAPALHLETIGGGLSRLTWPAAVLNVLVEGSSEPTTGWLPLPGTPERVGQEWVLTNALSQTRQFYRLRPRISDSQ